MYRTLSPSFLEMGVAPMHFHRHSPFDNIDVDQKGHVAGCMLDHEVIVALDKHASIESSKTLAQILVCAVRM